MTKSLKANQLELGVCYYPEHWPEDLWENDYERMRELGFSYVRLAEFAWSIFEPEEGNFSFNFFDRAIDLAHKHGLKVILGTPTATPPAWLTHKYPEVLNVSQQGVQFQHGMRRHYNYNSKKYRELSARIVTKMAEHYHNHPAVVGWQIDNELNCEIDVFYSDADHESFRSWVKNKYGTLDKVNKAWGTTFWSQTYTSWDQIFLPRPTVNGSKNPHQLLDEKRFISDSAISYAKLQADLIRKFAPNHWITTNGMFNHLDNHRLTDELLDFFAYDSYPNFSKIFPDQGEKPLLDRKWSWNLSAVRSISNNFAIFEQQSGPGGWVDRIEQPSPLPGQIRLWTYQSVAHGADMILYFRWRTATFGSEIYWHGINDYHNQPNRRIAEIKEISQELMRIKEKIVGAKFKAEAAIVTDYDNQWDGETDKWYGPYIKQSEQEWFKAFQYNHIPVDALNFDENTNLSDLTNYKLLVYPHPAIMTDRKANLLKQYVEKGGKVVFGCRSGYKDVNGQPYMLPFPGVLRELVGVTVEDFTRVGEYQEIPEAEWATEIFQVNQFNEVLNNDNNTEILARYKNAYYENKPAAVKSQVGKGTTIYFGGVFTLDIANVILDELEISKTVESIELSEAVELAIREKDGVEYIFLLNYSDSSQTITFKEEWNELITKTKLNGTIEMKGFEVLILERRRK
ncbi:beta-galactosidase [Aquibacillus albus]|uniref:Beta-galactosidase n=1 Tax=Aquibacillus albus TaxID=1168171 RepID=A0ABS2MX01_9BACI|nr:beta-galactosidase [Aquibacillus albus]MBM7570409.1 beta-galactosidase [Aquibacillus albus]